MESHDIGIRFLGGVMEGHRFDHGKAQSRPAVTSFYAGFQPPDQVPHARLGQRLGPS